MFRRIVEALARQGQDHLETGRVLHHLGILVGLLGQYDEAKQQYEENWLISPGNGDRIGRAMGTLEGVVAELLARLPIVEKRVSSQ